MRVQLRSLAALMKRPFLMNVMKVGAGGALAQAISLGFSPLIARQYGPMAIGHLSVFLSVVAVCVTMATLAYPVAIVLPRTRSEARLIARLSMVVALCFCLVAQGILLLPGSQILDSVGLQGLPSAAFLLPLGVILASGVMVMEQWLTRERAFGLFAASAVFTSLVLNVSKAGFGYVRPTSEVLIATTLAAQAIGLLVVTAKLRWSGTSSLVEEEGMGQRDRLSVLARRYRDFPLFRAPQLLLNAVSLGLPVVLLAAFFGASVAGQYSLAWSLLFAPILLAGRAVSSVFYPKITAALRDGGAKRLVASATWGMALSGAIPYGLLLVLGPWLVAFVFGEEWRLAGVFSQVLAPFMFLQYLNRPVIAALPGMRLQASLLLYEVVSTSSKVSALWIGFKVLESPVWAVGLFSLVGVITYLWLIASTMRRLSGWSPADGA